MPPRGTTDAERAVLRAAQSDLVDLYALRAHLSAQPSTVAVLLSERTLDKRIDVAERVHARLTRRYTERGLAAAGAWLRHNMR